MKRTIVLLALAFALALGTLPAVASPGGLAPLHEATGEAVDGSYIVVLEDGRAAEAVAAATGITTTHVFAEVLDGFTATLDAAELDRVRRHPHVAYVEQDQVMEASGIQSYPPWGLDRIDQPWLPLNDLYHWWMTGRGVNAYIFDTGLWYPHPEFQGRALFAVDVFGGNGLDCHGHGTHVGGTVGARTYGVAKQVTLWSARVLDCGGNGTLGGIIYATDWVAVNHRRPAVANYSLGGGASATLNAAIDYLSDAGVFVVAAAGNSGTDACNISPAGASEAYTAGASDINDNVPTWSNYGPCMNIYAPGVAVQSTWLNNGTAVLSGTSMAAPHVTGAAALYKSYGDAPSSVVAAYFTALATPGVLSGVPPNTPNLLLYKGGL